MRRRPRAAELRLMVVALALGLGVLAPIVLFARVASSTIAVDIVAQAERDRSEAAVRAAKLVDEHLAVGMRELQQLSQSDRVVIPARPPAAAVLRDRSAIEAALVEALTRSQDHDHLALYARRDTEVALPQGEFVAPAAAAARGGSGEIRTGSDFPEIRAAIDGDSRFWQSWVHGQVTHGAGSLFGDRSHAWVGPAWAPRGGTPRIFIRTAFHTTGATLVVAPRPSEMRRLLEGVLIRGRSVSVLARSATDPARVVSLAATGDMAPAPPTGTTLERAFLQKGDPAKGGATVLGERASAVVETTDGSRAVAYAPIGDGEWVVSVVDDPAVTFAAYKRMADQLLVGTEIAILLAALLAVLLVVFLGRLEHQRRVIESANADLAVANTALADATRHLEAASRHKSEFLANMSHELRTPLNAVIGFSDVLAQGMAGPLSDKQTEYIRDISTSGKHLLDLVNEILDLSKVEAGRMELERSEFAAADAILSTFAFVRERAARHGIELAADVPADLGTLVADERKVRQVLLNLLSNAVKFTPDGGWIGVTARRESGELRVSVRDSGIGIAPEDQAKIFEEFRQVGKASDRAREGTGLGLTLAKRFVELNGGRIWFESEPGKGTTFTFALPVGSEVSATA